MKKNQKFDFFVFAFGLCVLLIGILRGFTSIRPLLCDAWGIGERCIVPQTHLPLHILLDGINVLINLFILGIGVALILHTLRLLFQKKSPLQTVPPENDPAVQKFYMDNPLSKIAAKVGIGIMMCMFLGMLALSFWGTVDFTTDTRDIALTVVLALTSLLPLAGMRKFYLMQKNPILYVSSEGIQSGPVFTKWSEVSRCVCAKTPKRSGIYLELLQEKKQKSNWLLRQKAVYLDEYYMLSLAQREVFKQALRAYIPVEEADI